MAAVSIELPTGDLEVPQGTNWHTSTLTLVLCGCSPSRIKTVVQILEQQQYATKPRGSLSGLMFSEEYASWRYIRVTWTGATHNTLLRARTSLARRIRDALKQLGLTSGKDGYLWRWPVRKRAPLIVREMRAARVDVGLPRRWHGG